MSTKRPVLDTKIQDTSADQIWRNIGHGMLATLCLLWLFLEPITGVIATAVTITLVVKADRRRKQRYSNNARRLADLHRGGLR